MPPQINNTTTAITPPVALLLERLGVGREKGRSARRVRQSSNLSHDPCAYACVRVRACAAGVKEKEIHGPSAKTKSIFQKKGARSHARVFGLGKGYSLAANRGSGDALLLDLVGDV